MPLGECELARELLLEAAAIEETRERVVVGEVLEPPLEELALGDVLDLSQEVQRLPVGVAHQGCADLDRDQVPVGMDVALLVAVDGDPAADQLLGCPVVVAKVLGGSDRLEGHALELLARIPGDLAERRVHVLEAPVQRGDGHADRCAIEGRPKVCLRRTNRLVGAPALGHVLDLGDHVQRSRLVAHGRYREIDPRELAVRAPVAALEAEGPHIAGEQASHEFEALVELVRVRDILDAHLEQLLLRMAGDPDELPVHPEKPALGRDQRHADRGLLERVRKARLGLLERAVRLLELGDVGAGDDVALDGSGLVAQLGRACRDPDEPAVTPDHAVLAHQLLAAPRGPAAVGQDDVALVRVQGAHPTPAGGLLRRNAAELTEAPVDEHAAAVGVQFDDPDGGVLRQRTEAALAAAESLLRLSLHRHVLHRAAQRPGVQIHSSVARCHSNVPTLAICSASSRRRAR